MPNNGPVKFTLAVDDYNPSTKTREPIFIDCVAWSKLGDVLKNYATKGRQIALAGRISIREYTDKQGNKRKATEIVASDIELLAQGLGQQQQQDSGSDTSW